jgi:hypothetical protein
LNEEIKKIIEKDDEITINNEEDYSLFLKKTTFNLFKRKILF